MSASPMAHPTSVSAVGTPPASKACSRIAPTAGHRKCTASMSHCCCSSQRDGRRPRCLSTTTIFILYTYWSARFSHLYSILPHPSILYIILYPLYPLWDTLITLSKYIHVWYNFEGFIETNLMVQSEFNLNFWFVSYSIFSFV
jgi:hypothetical protein